jgi:hypothetical protein
MQSFWRQPLKAVHARAGKSLPASKQSRVRFIIVSVRMKLFELAETNLQLISDSRMMLIASSLGTGSVVEGTVMEFSDCGQRPCFLAVVEVARRQQIVVPVERLIVVKPPADLGG